jgi:protein-S-isoprenylcysteine O-methyltransferase Ste14
MMLVLILGSIITVIGVILVFWTIIHFKTKGQGTPNPKLPPKKLIIGGPYEYSRNPVALGGLLILLSESAIYHSPSLLGISIYVRRKYYDEPE